MQRFAFLLLAASVALLAIVVPAGAALLGKRETNAQRFARGLPPLPPARRSPTETAKRRQVSRPSSSSFTTGRLEVRWAVDGTVLGHVSNDPIRGPIGLNAISGPNPATGDLTVEFSGSSLLAQDPLFPAPYYIGGYGTDLLSPQNTNTIQFINVDFGPDAKIWSLDTTSGALNATWTNPDNTKVRPTLIFHADSNVLSFTSNPLALYNSELALPVSIFLTQ